MESEMLSIEELKERGYQYLGTSDDNQDLWAHIIISRDKDKIFLQPIVVDTVAGVGIALPPIEGILH